MDRQKEKIAIERLRAFEPSEKPYYLCYSGGKDSDCIRILAALAGVKHEIHHNLTTVDAPETVQYIKSVHDVIIDRPKLSMWRLIENKKYPPTRISRYCCSELKERRKRPNKNNRCTLGGVFGEEAKWWRCQDNWQAEINNGSG
jgi:phosphoadenosine phosphosulfate reductase